MNENYNLSISELDSKPLLQELGSSYVQELIEQSDLRLTNEEMDLFPEVRINSFIKEAESEPNKSVLITEIDLESNYNKAARKISNGILESFIEEVEVNNQISRTTVGNQIISDGDYQSDESISGDNAENANLSVLGKEDLWDTDLEEDFINVKENSSTSAYIDLCTKYEVIPVKYYLQNMQKSILSVKHHGLGPFGTKALAKSLESNFSVDTLDLSGNWIYPIGSIAIGKMLEENNFISKLVLCDNMIGDQGLVGFHRALEVNRGLKHLDISGNQITDHGCIELCKLIVKSKYLTELVLSRNNIDSKGAQLLATAISSNDILEYLDLSWNQIRREGAVDIAKGLKDNIRIKNCNLSYNGFAKDGGFALADTLKDNSALIVLNIESNRIDGETAALIGKALKSNETLKELRIGNNTIDTNGILSLMSSINSYDASPLRSLYLTNVPIDFEISKVIEQIQLKRPDFKCIHGFEIGVGNTQEDIRKRLTNYKHILILLKEHVLIKDKRLIDILMKIDEDNKKFVTLEQFSQALQELGIPFKKVQLNDIKNQLDKLGNGTIYYGDFVPNTEILNEIQEDEKHVEE